MLLLPYIFFCRSISFTQQTVLRHSNVEKQLRLSPNQTSATEKKKMGEREREIVCRFSSRFREFTQRHLFYDSISETENAMIY